MREASMIEQVTCSLPKAPFDSVVCFGGEDWWYHNRGHIDMQIMRRFARLGTTIYVNSIVMQKPNLKEGKKFFEKVKRKAMSIFRGLKKSDAGFWVYSPFSLPVHHIDGLRKLNELILRMQLRLVTRKLGIGNPIIWVACPAACEIALRMRRAKLVYQRTDRFEEFPNVDAETIRRLDQKLKATADLTIFVNRTLYQEERNFCRKAVYLDHGVDYEMFARANESPEVPQEMVGIPHPIVGFYGGFAEHTTNIDLLKRLVELLPEKSFVFIGNPSPQCQSLKAMNNVWMLGQKPYEQIPHYGKCFDVAIMPWKQNRWIDGCNPIKLKEYLALGKPVVSTPFSELNNYRDVVYEAETPAEFAECIRRALAEDCLERIAARREKIRGSTWDSKARIVAEELFGTKGGE
jgi:glycosyltransferase involved in cell wall biosynthesis